MGRIGLPDMGYVLEMRDCFSLMRFLSFTALLVGLALPVNASDTLPVIRLTDEVSFPLQLGNFMGVLPMQRDGQITSEEVVLVPDSVFVPGTDLEKIPPHYNAWIKFTIVNATDRPLNH